MTQTQLLRAMFEDHGGRLTLGEIMQTYLAASYRQRMTDLKRELFSEGKTITCYPVRVDGSKSLTCWQIEDLPRAVESSGQVLLAI
jgi:hypothetical protein